MSGELIDVSGRDMAGTTEFIFYDNGGAYTLLGSASNTTSAVAAKTLPNVCVGLLHALVYLPTGDNPANIVVYNQAGTI